MDAVLGFLREHWPVISAIIAALLAGKKWMGVKGALLAVMTGAEGLHGRGVREKVAEVMQRLKPSVQSEIKNMAAKTDPSILKRPSIKESLKSLVPNLLRIGLKRVLPF